MADCCLLLRSKKRIGDKAKSTVLLIKYAERQALANCTIQTARACSVRVLKPMCIGDLSRIDK